MFFIQFTALRLVCKPNTIPIRVDRFLPLDFRAPPTCRTVRWVARFYVTWKSLSIANCYSRSVCRPQRAKRMWSSGTTVSITKHNSPCIPIHRICNAVSHNWCIWAWLIDQPMTWPHFDSVLFNVILQIANLYETKIIDRHTDKIICLNMQYAIFYGEKKNLYGDNKTRQLYIIYCAMLNFKGNINQSQTSTPDISIMNSCVCVHTLRYLQSNNCAIDTNLYHFFILLYTNLYFPLYKRRIDRQRALAFL